MFHRSSKAPRTFTSCGPKAGLIFALMFGLTSGAAAQIASPAVNISPVASDRDNSNPNSASGGRVNQLAAHPNNDQVYFAASEWGGLYRTADRGQNWTYVPGHVPQATWDVEYDPTDADVLVTTSFFDGKVRSLSGINVSRDGGLTWSVPATARPALADCAIAAAAIEPAAFGVAFDPDDPDNLYAGTNCGLAISNDGGLTWRFADPTPGDGGGLNVFDVIVHNDGIIDVCGDDGHQRSTDGGANFVAGANEVGGVCSLAASPDENDVLFMSVGTQIFESRDGGGTWPTTFVNPGSQGRIPFVRVNDRTGNAFDLWFGDTQLFRASCTTPANVASNAQRCPASNTWTNAQTGGHWDVGDLAFDPDDGVNACPVIFSNDGGVYFNQRSGSNCHDPRWEQPQQSVTALWLWDMDGNARIGAGEEGIYIGQQDSGAFGTRDAPVPAPDWNSPACCDVFDVEAEDNRVVYTVCCFTGGRATRMFLDDDSMDGGSEVASYPTGNLIGFRDTDSLTNFAPNSYAIATSSGIFFTTNIAANPVTWQQLGSVPPAGICGIFNSRRTDGTPVFTARVGGCGLGQTGALWQHVGATATGNWARVERNGQSQFGAFGVDPRNPSHIVASDHAGAIPAMMRTVDGGTNWTPLTALDAKLTGNGAFVAWNTSGPTNFTGFGGYPQASLVAISPADSDMIVAAGQDSGVFISTDGGVSWRLLSDPLTNYALRPHVSRPLFAHFESFFNGHVNLYIGARGRGVWRVVVNRPTYVATTDFDGDGTGDVAIGSPWGIGTLEKSGDSFSSLAIEPNGSRVDGWLLNTADNRLEVLADLNGDDRSEMIVTSPWGIGVLRLNESTYGAYMLEPNGTRFGGWLLNTEDNKVGPAGDFDGDGRHEFLVSSPWGIGVFEFDGSTFTVPFMAPNGTRFDGWLLNTADNRFGPVGDFDADGRDEVMVSSPWGIGVFNIDSGGISTPALKPNGTRFDGWLLNTADNRFGPVGDFDADGQDDIIVRSPWGIGILNLSDNTFSGLMLRPNGTDFGGWLLDTANNHGWAAGNFSDAMRDDLFVTGPTGMAIQRFDESAKTFSTTVMLNHGARVGGWLLDTTNNLFAGFRDLTGDNRADILVSSPWGIGLLRQNGTTLTLPVIARNGTRFGGWLLNTADNKFW